MALNIKIGDVISNLKIISIDTPIGGITRSKLKVKYLCCGLISTISYTAIANRVEKKLTRCRKCEKDQRLKTLKETKQETNHFTDEENRIYNMWGKYQ